MMSHGFDPDFSGPSEWAHAYRKRMLNVVPAVIATEKKKHPIAGWREFQYGLVPQFLFDRWYAMGGEHVRNYSMGFITGPASLPEGEALLLIDIDVKNGALGPQTWQAWLDEHENGIEPETWTARTGSGGRHVYFRYPAHLKIYNTQTTFNGIDVRAEGGFVMAPPSPHYMPGTVYAWGDIGPLEENDTLAEAPGWLIAICTHIGEAEGASKPRTHAERVAAVEEINAFGKRTNGREAYMTRVVWGAVLDLRREAPMKPGQRESELAMLRAYEVYVAHVKTRLPTTNEEGLEREGRGLTLFQEKWAAAMRQWDTKVAQEAAKEKPARPSDGVDTVDPAPPLNDDGPILVASLTGEPAERKWVVRDWIPAGVVTSLYGDGGLGKTLIAQQLLYAVGIGGKFLGMDVPKLRGLGVFCEDDKDELHRRHKAIKAHLGHAFGNPFDETWLWPRVGFDNLLVTFDRNNAPVLSPFFVALEQRVVAERIELLVLDNAADLFGGNEIIRAQVNFFVKAVIGRLIQRAAEAGWTLSVLLLAHPSQAGRNNGTGESGSTGWNAAVRARMYLTRGEDGDPDARVLTRMKANYAASGQDTGIVLRWQEGVIDVPRKGPEQPLRGDLHGLLKQELDRAWKAGSPYSLAPQTRREGRYAPMVLGSMFDTPAVQIQRIIQQWLDNRVVVVETAEKREKLKGIKVLAW